ncbi:MAG: hypothetical protein R3F56_04380 [Planctomycetota bacterium]
MKPEHIAFWMIEVARHTAAGLDRPVLAEIIDILEALTDEDPVLVAQRSLSSLERSRNSPREAHDRAWDAVMDVAPGRTLRDLSEFADGLQRCFERLRRAGGDTERAKSATELILIPFRLVAFESSGKSRMLRLREIRKLRRRVA